MSNEVYDFNIGHSTAYAYAKASGDLPEGMTPEEYGELLASYATVGQTAVTAAQTATTKASEAATSATTATNKASEATTAATTATTKAGEASTSASTATSAKDTAVSASQTATTKATEATTAAATATSAKTDAVAANTAAQSAKTAAQTAQTGAETAAASVEASAEQIATNAADISQLKSDLNTVDNAVFAYVERTATAVSEGWRLNANDGLCSQNSSYKLLKFGVVPGDVIKVVSDDRFQFNTVASVPASGTSNRVGVTYGTGEFVLEVPETATYLIVSTFVSNSSAKALIRFDNIKSMTEALTSVEELTIKEESIAETNSIKSGLTWTDGYYMGVNGTAQANSSYSYSSEIPVEEGDVISIPSTYGNFRFVTAYANGSAISTKGTDATTKTYTVPSDITSVIVTMDTLSARAESVYIELTHTEIVKSNILDADVEALQSDVTEIRANIENIPTENLDTVTRTGHNYLEDISEEHENKYWNGSTIGIPISLSNNSDYVAVLLPITRHGVYHYNSPYNNMRFVHYLDEDKKLLSVDTSPMKTINATNESIKYVAVTIYKASYATSTIVFGDEVPYDRYLVKKQWVFEDLVSNRGLHSYLPPEICVGSGRTIELYNNLVLLEADKYHLHWSCGVGVAYSRKFSIVGTDNNIGTYPLTLTIYDDNLNAVKTLTSTVKVVSNQIESAINIVPIGDSLTNLKAWLPAVKTLSNDKILYIGTRGNNGQYHEGRSGASAAWYNANSTYTFDNSYVGNPSVDGDSNPFWDGSKFSLEHYINNQSSYIGTPDAVQILLGTNGMSIDPTATVNNIKTMVDNIIAEYPNMPIFVCNTIYRSNQDGYHSTGADGYVAASGFQFNEDVKVMNLQNALHDALGSYSNVYIVPLSVCMDRDNDFGQVEVPVNPRLADVTTHIASESVHPQAAGYLQMADVMYSAYIAHLT